jgi:hypothetical protein
MFGLSNNDIIVAAVFILAYLCFASLFAKEDNNNDPNKIPKRVENYADLPDYSGNFAWDPRWLGDTNKDCYKLNEKDCLKYSNCGLCLSDGKAQCIPGDDVGPLFKEGCERWVHANYKDRSLFGERTVSIVPPHDYRYHDYEALPVSPQSRATL